MVYVVLFQDGIFPRYEPDPPADDIRAATLDDARAVFARLARQGDRDGIPTDDGGPWADLYPEDAWDGISYGDYPAYRITVGPRGALHLDRT